MSTTDLAALISRLEAATSRLEHVASAKPDASRSLSSSAAPVAATSSSLQLTAFDEIISGPLKDFLSLSEKVGGLVKDQADLVAKAFDSQRQIIETASASKKPDISVFQTILKPLQGNLEAIGALRDKNRPSALFNHLSTVSDGVPALGWVAVEPAPAPYVGELRDAANFYSNRVIKEYKEKDKSHVEWANSFISLLTDLQAYVKKWHTTGLAWNPKGGDAKSFSAAPKSTPAVSAPAPTATTTPVKPAALFAALNKEGLTSGLKKVDKSEMTHKNPELRASGVVKVTETSAPSSAPKSFVAPKAPPKTELQGLKWVVENHVNNNEVVIDKTDLKYTVYIYNCTNSTIKINGKVNAITLDNCKKTGLVIESAVSSVDIVNCKSCQVQITGKAPTVAIDKTDGIQLYLSTECLDVDILSAKSSEMNILFQETKGADFIERAVVEQYRTKIVHGKLVTVPVEHKG